MVMYIILLYGIRFLFDTENMEILYGSHAQFDQLFIFWRYSYHNVFNV